MTSFIAACGSGRSTSVIPAVPAALSVTTIAFIWDLPSTKRLKGRSELSHEDHWLLPCREVAALLDLVVIEQFGICPLRPAAWSLVLLAGEDSHGHRDLDTLGIEEAALVLPIDTGGRDSRIRQPI